MGTISTANGSWMTSFFYGEDLRSLYMNGILNAGFRPGIYNTSMALYAENNAGSTSTKVSGIKLFIKKGTTLIFSNNYKLGSNGYERNIDEIGTYAIKCVAEENATIDLVDLVSGTPTYAIDYILGTSATQTAPKEFYVVAKMKYDPDNDLSSSVPEFQCLIKNPNYNASGSTLDEKLIFRTPSNTSKGWSEYPIPDGCSADVPVTTRTKTSYLILGTVISTATGKYYAADQSWRSGYDVEWINDHIFTGRGLIDYRHNFIASDTNNTPDYIMCPDMKKLYLDAPNLLVKDKLYSISQDWKNVHRLPNKENYPVISSYDYTISSTNLEEELKAKVGSGTEESPTNLLVTEAVFLNSRSRYSHIDYTGYSVEDMFSKLDTDTNPGMFIKTPEVKSVRFISKCAFTNMDPHFDNEDDTTASCTHINYGPELDKIKIVPLDVGKANVERLLTLLRNRNILPIVIDYMRQNNIIDAVNSTSLIPSLLIFRKYKVYKKDEDVIVSPVDNISALGYDVIDPANILSFFDLEFKTAKANIIDINSEDVYSILPIIS